jgi:phage baseplate assembly protein W
MAIADTGIATSQAPKTIYDPELDIWPDLEHGRIVLRPVRVGMDRRTGKILIGWDHVVQSLHVIFATRYHSRVLRRWVGSFVPHLLGENATERTVARFYWAIVTAMDLFEPNFRVQIVRVAARADGTSLTSPEELRTGHLSSQNEGVYRPRAHLGIFTPEGRRHIGLITSSASAWETAA